MRHTYSIDEYDVREEGFGGTQISPDFATPEEAERWLADWKRTHPKQLRDSNWARRLSRAHRRKEPN